MPQLAPQRRALMAYADVGTGVGDAPPVLLVHGWAANGGFFAPQLGALAARHRVIAPDLAGHGASRSGFIASTIAGMADDLAELMDDLGLKNVLAVGWSMGASVLWELLGRGGDSPITGLVTVDMTPRILNDDTWRLGLSDGFDTATSVSTVASMRADWPQFSARVAGNVFGPDGAPEPLIRFARAAFADNDPDVMAQAWTSMTAFDARPLVQAIKTPTLVTYGARSKLYAPGVSAWLADNAPNATRIAFQRSGHAPHLEEPERFNNVLSEFATILSGQDARRDIKQLGRDAATRS